MLRSELRLVNELPGKDEGRLSLTFDRLPRASLSVPLTLPLTRNGALVPGDIGDAADVNDSSAFPRAYMGFTASTSEASERHDILRARFCHNLGCAAL